MEKQEIIDRIQDVLVKWGEFNIYDIDGEVRPCIASHGNMVDFGEYFNNTSVGIEVYNTKSKSSDAIDSYDLDYEDLDIDVLAEILIIAERYEVQEEKLFDSIRDNNY
jgi:hypothetical protein